VLNAVMVDDDHIDTQPLRQQNLPLRVDAVVDREQQIRTAQGEFMDGKRTETVPFVPVGQIRLRLNSETGQTRAQNVRSENTVAVIVAKDCDPPLVADGGKHAVDCIGHPRNRRRIGKIVPGWWLNERINVLNPTGDEDVEQWLAQKHTPPHGPDRAQGQLLNGESGLRDAQVVAAVDFGAGNGNLVLDSLFDGFIAG
jgi:hypothetical protein